MSTVPRAGPREASRIFDFDNHYYEAPDAFTRYQDRSLGHRGVRWADIDGRRRLLVGGTINSYVANPTFDPVARPGSLYDWYRGNPRGQRIVEAFGELEPLRPEYQDRAQRLAVLDEQGLAGELTAHVRVDRLLLGSDWPHAEGTRTPADFVTSRSQISRRIKCS